MCEFSEEEMTRGTISNEKASFNVARLKAEGELFEVVVHPEQAMAFRENPTLDLDDVLVSENIFSDAKKGLVTAEQSIQRVFNTEQPLEAIKQILLRGEIQMSAEYRQRMRDEKKKQVIHLIVSRASDPVTKLPHPPQRIENALAEAKVTIDERRSAEQQLEDIVKKIRPILPITLATHRIEVIIPARYASKSYGVLKSKGTLLKDEWQQDGSLLSVVEMPAGHQQSFIDELNNITQGNVKTTILSE